ncbi:MAG: hypothetical protein KKG59_05720 [Nanoarchaeota archaeon]|nr:hypothetical protein [Nanoarchaeota archaeon]
MGNIVEGKLYISAQELQEQSLEIAENVLRSDFDPDYLIALWRGGTPVGCYVHEFMQYVGKMQDPKFKLDHAPLGTFGYEDNQLQKEVKVYGIDLVLDRIKEKGHKRILVVDDVFDTGKTLATVTGMLPAELRLDVRIAVPYWKKEANKTQLKPDFYNEILPEETWIVFPHEMEQRTLEELRHKGGSYYVRVKRLQKLIQHADSPGH